MKTITINNNKKEKIFTSVNEDYNNTNKKKEIWI